MMLIRIGKGLAVAGLLLLSLSAYPALAEEKPAGSMDLAPGAASAVLMDSASGAVIFEKNSHAKLPPASITKVMTMLLIMEALEKGTIKLDEKVSTSEYAASMGGSQIFLEVGEAMTVDDLLKGIAMASGNDASVAMAEKIAGSESAFVDLMNNKAKELGMNDTHFANCNGLPAQQHYTSAHDIAIMSKELLQHEQITKYTSAYQDYLRKDSAKPFWLVNTNKLVRFYSGADGLKTGYTSEAKYCLSATAKRDQFRVISVVLGEPNTKTRNSETAAMFDYAFAQYTSKQVIKAGDDLGHVKVEKGKVQSIKLTAVNPYSVLLRKGEQSDNIRYELHVDPSIAAPVKLGQSLGKLIIYKADKQVAELNIDSPVSVDKAGWWILLKRVGTKLFVFH